MRISELSGTDTFGLLSGQQSDLPLARIKRVMKSDEDVRMISAEAPILFARVRIFLLSKLNHQEAFQLTMFVDVGM